MVTEDSVQGEIELRPQRTQAEEEDEIQLQLQLKEAGRRLSNPQASIEELLYVLDQLWKLLLKVDQSPNDVMKDALSLPMKALVNGRLLEHSSLDVKVSVASCLCEITRVTAPEAPYSDEEMKGVFQCIVSSLENLSDISSRCYEKRVSILDSISQVRSCVIMLDLECDDLIVKLFEHFLNSVRDHHRGDIFSLMANIMTLVLEESEDISLDLLKLLFASVKNNSEGVLPVARKLGEEVIKKSADKIQPCLNKAMVDLGKSLADYSQLLTSISDGTTDFLEHNNESAPNQPKAVDPAAENVSFEDAAKVVSIGDTITGNEENVDSQHSKNPEGAVDQPGSNSNSKLDNQDPAFESENIVSELDTTKSAEVETVQSESIAEKSPEVAVSVQKPLEKDVSDAPSQSGSQQEKSQYKIQIKKGIRSKKKGLSPTDLPSTVALLTTVNEVTSDPEMRSPKRVRKKTEKAEENKPSATTGSDVEPSKNSGKKVKTDDSGPKPAKRSRKKVSGGGSVAKKPKLSGKEVPESKKSQLNDSKEEVGDSAAKKPKLSGKKVPESKKSKEDDDKEAEVGDSVANKPKLSDKKVPESEKPKQDDNKEVEAVDPVAKKPKLSVKKVPESKKQKYNDNREVEAGDSVDKSPKQSLKKDKGTDSVAKKLKLSGKKVPESKKQKQDDTKEVESGDTEVKSAKQSLKKDNGTDSTAKPLKLSGKKGQKRKVITKPSEDIANKDEETDSDNKLLKLSENKEEETDSDRTPLNLSENKDEEETETDSDNIPLRLSAKRLNKSSSSVVESSSKNKDGKKQGRAENVEEKNQTKSLSDDDDGMDVSLKSVLKKTTKGKGNLEGALSTGSKRKRSVTKKKVTETIKYDGSLVGQKIKVWWPEDKMYYEGIVESFDSAEKKHKVSYVDGDVETLNLREEKWEVIKEFSSAPDKEVAVEVQNTDILPEIGSSEGESKVNTKEVKSKENEKLKKDAKKAAPQEIVYSRGKKGSKSKTKSSVDNVKESEGGNAAKEPESEKEKSTETPKTGSKTAKKKRKMK